MKRALSFLVPALLLAAVAHADNPSLKPENAKQTPVPATPVTAQPDAPSPTQPTFEKPHIVEGLVMPEVGKDAPGFKLPSQDGSEVKLEDYKGKWVVLYFYPKDFTGGCTLEAKNFQADLDKFKAKDTVVLGVSLDPVASHKDFCTKESLTFKLLSDGDHKVAEKYGSLMEYKGQTFASRSTFVINPDGKIVKVYPSVNPTKHSTEVLADLETLQKAKKG